MTDTTTPEVPPPAASAGRTSEKTRARVEDLRPHPRNPRTISPARLEQLQRTLAAEPDLLDARPIIALPDGTVVAGNQRLAAAVALGWESIPVVYADLSPEEVTRWMLLDNRGFGEDDRDAVAVLLGELEAADSDLDLTGYEAADLDAMLRELHRPAADPDEVPPVPVVARSVVGEVYELGPHRLMCGDSTDAEVLRGFLPAATCDFVFADPPYGISAVKVRRNGKGTTGNTGGSNPFGDRKGRVHGDAHRAIIRVNEYRPVIGDDTTATALAAYIACVSLAPRVLVFWGGNHYCEGLPPTRGWLVWDKELDAPAFSEAELAWTNLDQPIRMFRHKWAGLMKASERGQARVHPTQKPAALAAWCLERFGREGDVVLDPFSGSGSALIGAEMCGRTCYALELDPAYCDVIRQRYADYVGDQSYAP